MVTRPVALVAAITFCNTFAIGAFPVLLPDIGSEAGFDDVVLGMLAGAFGLARLIADIPAGLLIAHHLRRAMLLGALCLSLGNLLLVSGGPLPVLLAGRALYGAGHALAMLSGLLTVARFAGQGAHGFSLNVYEFSGMTGMLLGMALVAVLPGTWSWHLTLLVASLPQFVGVALLPWLLREMPPDRVVAAESAAANLSSGGGRVPVREILGLSRLTVLAYLAGCMIAVAWAAVGQFILPLRAARDFELSREGVALLLAVPQVFDVCLLLPVGKLADRVSRVRLLGFILLLLCAGVAAMAFGSLSFALVGCALFGLGLASWMLPVGLLGRPASPRSAAWRTALYRVCIDIGVFFGPLISGVLAKRGHLWMMGAFCALGLLGLSVALFQYARREDASTGGKH